ncbi:DUF3667 domain-containing protein [Qipengyuania sp. MTN3-11]|uniref:DUF3667 domain-containing protein n=1 Tax=Qipengyuania sp. MTN3-11 TaxID=3056557 RepID=UPI0036F2178B
MSDFGEGLGTAVEGGLFARAIDRHGGDRNQPSAAPLSEGHFAEDICLNCQTALIGSHCHQCGQKAHFHRTMGAFLHDLLHGALHFEGKTWKTLPLLATKPGALTRRYIEGERARFVSPMAMFLFSIFLMFAIFQAVGLTMPTDIDVPGNTREGLAIAERGAVAELAATERALEAAPADDPSRGELEGRVTEAEADLRELRRGEQFLLEDENSPMQFDVGTTGIGFIDSGLKKWQTNPGLMLYKLQANGYKFSWLLIPISIPFLWLLFVWKRRFRAYDHAIFVTYSIAFMSLFFIVLSIMVKIGAPAWLWGLMLALVPPIHIYKQLRGAYGLSRFSATWRLAVLLVFINVVVLLFVQLLLLLGAF